MSAIWIRRPAPRERVEAIRLRDVSPGLSPLRLALTTPDHAQPLQF